MYICPCNNILYLRHAPRRARGSQAYVLANFCQGTNKLGIMVPTPSYQRLGSRVHDGIVLSLKIVSLDEVIQLVRYRNLDMSNFHFRL
jgi:hypothetical protein